MLETSLYSRLRPKLSVFGALDRVENSIGSGMWDLHLCCEGTHNWVEMKMEKKGGMWFERHQLQFARRQLRAGATNLYVICGFHTNKKMLLFSASDLLGAPRRIVGKWQVLELEDLEPVLKMHPPYDWESLRRLLSMRHVSLDKDSGYTETPATEEDQ